jgi:hypothetical protein
MEGDGDRVTVMDFGRGCFRVVKQLLELEQEGAFFDQLVPFEVGEHWRWEG